MIKHLLMILIIVQFSLGQQTQEGAPYSQIQSLGNNYQTITLPQVNNDALLEEDTYRVIGTPYRYGYKHEVFILLQTLEHGIKLPMEDFFGKLVLHQKMHMLSVLNIKIFTFLKVVSYMYILLIMK